jgi:hypothetical protein
MTDKTLSATMCDIIGVTGGECNTCHWRDRTNKLDLYALDLYKKAVAKHYKKYKTSVGRDFSKPKKLFYCAKKRQKKDNCEEYELNSNIKLSMITTVLKPQFPNSVEGDLMLGVILQSIRDLYDDEIPLTHYHTKVFLSKIMPPAEICGVDSGWVTKVIKGCGVDLTVTEKDINIVNKKVDELKKIADGSEIELSGLRIKERKKKAVAIKLEKVNSRLNDLLIYEFSEGKNVNYGKNTA